MKRLPIVLGILLAVPLFEIWLLIQVGGYIGAGWTVFLVVFTAFAGLLLVRHQGLSTIARMQQVLLRGELPALELLEGVSILFAGALLLTPGFFTDALGLALLVPGLRRGLLRRVSSGLLGFARFQSPGKGPPEGSPPRTIEGEYKREKD